jgi:hypothetical protein
MGDGYSNVGVHGSASGDNREVFGVIGNVYGGGTDARYAVYGDGSNASGTVYAGYFDGDLAYTGSLLNLSDRKFKTNLRPCEGALAKVLALEPKKYNYATENTDARVALPRGEHYGLIAQDVEEIFPELVGDLVHPDVPMPHSDDPRGKPFGYKGINYIELIPVLVQAIKEQQETIADNRRTIDELRAEVETLKKK